MPKLYWFISLLLITLYSQAQEPAFIRGQILDPAGAPLVDALVWTQAENLHRSDSLGQIHFPLQEEANHLWVWHSRYGAQAFSLDFHFREFLALRLSPLPLDSLPLAEDRLANLLQHAPLHAKVNQHFRATVYQENEARVNTVPFNLIGFSGVTAPPAHQVGTAYRSRALKQVRYYDRFHFQEKVLLQEEAGYILAENWHYLPHYALNPYQEHFFINGMSNRSFLSPVHLKNRSQYHYWQQAVYPLLEDSVYRIAFQGKPGTQGTMAGWLDIVKSTGRLLCIQLHFGPHSSLEAIDSLKIAVEYWPFGDAQRKLRQSHHYHLGLLGYDFSYHIAQAYLAHQYIADQSHSAEGLLAFERNRTAYSPQADSLLSTHQPAAWPYPENYYRKLSLQKDQPQWRFFRGSRLFREKFNWYSWLLQGHLFQKGDYYLGWAPFYKALGFNAIEGPYLRYALPLGRSTNQYEWQFTPEFRYGVSDRKLKLRANWTLNFDTLHPKSLRLSGGRAYRQFNPDQPVLPVINAINALFLGENLIRLYETDYFNLGMAFEPANGLSINLETEYGLRRPLFNATGFTFFERNHQYNPNNPTLGNVIRSFGFEPHRSLKIAAEIKYQFGQQYELRYNPRHHSRFVAKTNLEMQKPSLYLNNYWGVPSAFSVTHYWYTNLGLQYLFRTHHGLAQMDISSGFFPIKKQVPFVDFKHFDGIQLFFLQPTPEPRNRIKQFGTLPYYRFSTREAFLEIHLEHLFEGALLSRVDWMRKSKIHFLMGYNGLFLGNGRYFNEAFIGFNNIFKVMRLEFFIGKPSSLPWRQTVRVGFDINYQYYLNHRRQVDFQPL